MCLLGGKGTNCGEHGGVDSACIEQQSAEHFLHTLGVRGIEGRQGVWAGSVLGFGTILGFLPGMG